MLAAKAMGADTIIMTGKAFAQFILLISLYYILNNKDISQPRLDFAKQLGATYVVLAENDSQATAKRVVETLGSMPNISIECSGAESSIQATFYVSNSSLSKKNLYFF